MTHTIFKTFTLGLAALAVGLVPVLTSSAAEAKGGKNPITQDYQTNEPLHGYSGRKGSYYCDYIRIPNRVCKITPSGQEKCKIKGWTLRQTCY